MSEPTRAARGIIWGAIAFGILASLTGAGAGQDKSGGLRIAVVDARRVQVDYNYSTNAVSDLQKQQNNWTLVARTLQSNPLLDEKDQAELADLIIAENAPNGLNDTQKKRKQALLDKSKALNEEFETLRNKKVAEVTPQENARLTALTKSLSDAEVRLNDRQQKERDRYQQAAVSADSKVQKDVRDAIAKVAKEKGYNLVFTNEVVYYAEGDITDAVLGLLNKK